VFVDGRRAAAVALRAGRAVAKASALDRVRSFIDDDPIGILIAVCVILIGAVLLRRFSR
jgi:hypothetical protein